MRIRTITVPMLDSFRYKPIQDFNMLIYCRLCLYVPLVLMFVADLDHLQITNYLLEITGYLLKITNNLLQITSYLLEITNYLKAITNYLLEITNFLLEIIYFL